MVTLPSSDQSDVSIDTGAIVGGVIGTIIIIILVVMAITALVVAYKILSKKANYYGEKLVLAQCIVIVDRYLLILSVVYLP